MGRRLIANQVSGRNVVCRFDPCPLRLGVVAEMDKAPGLNPGEPERVCRFESCRLR